jgi:hypothetical protein
MRTPEHYPSLEGSYVLIIAGLGRKNFHNQTLNTTSLILFQSANQFDHDRADHYDSGHYGIFKPLIEKDVGEHALSVHVVVANIS